MLSEYVVIDMEMTGLSSYKDKIIEIGAVKVSNGEVSDTFQTLVNPNMHIDEKIVDITGITQEMVSDKPLIEDVLQDFLHFVDRHVLIGHNLKFDFSFMAQALFNAGMKEEVERDWYGIDTLMIARKCMAPEQPKKLEALCEYFGIKDEGHHRALADAMMTKELYEILCGMYERDNSIFMQEKYSYKPKKERFPSQKEIKRIESMIREYNITPAADIYKMSQSELHRYADYIRLNRYNHNQDAQSSSDYANF